jgi:hypothetical protein
MRLRIAFTLALTLYFARLDRFFETPSLIQCPKFL